jgi:phage shock protein A
VGLFVKATTEKLGDFMSSLWTGLFIFGAVVLVLAVFQRKNLGRIFTAIFAQFGKLARGVWSADPVAVMQAEVDRSADEIRDATTGLEQYRGLVTRLQRQVATGEKEVERLTVRVKAFLAENNEIKAAEYAVLLKKAETDLIENRSQLQGYESAYQNNLRKIQFARQKIEQAKEKARKLDAELRLSKAEAETARLAEKFNVRTNSLEGLGEIEEEIQRQIDTNRAKAQVMRDLSSGGLDQIAEEEAIQRQEAAEVLARFKSEMDKK